MKLSLIQNFKVDKCNGYYQFRSYKVMVAYCMFRVLYKTIC